MARPATAARLLVAAAILAVSAWIGFERVQLYANSSSAPAVIVSCKSKSFGRARGAGRFKGRSWSYAPIAVSDAGDKAIGTKFLPERAWCERLIGRKTTIRGHGLRPERRFFYCTGRPCNVER